MPNWLLADLMPVPVGFPGVAAVDVALRVGVSILGCDGGALVAGDVGSGAVGVPMPLGTSFAHPTSMTTHAMSAAMIHIRSDPLPMV
jgi:hypothetical protein